MSLRLEMLQVARLAPKLLGESSELVRNFLRRQQNADGSFKNRAGEPDLYYTVFGLDSLLALQAELPTERVAAYLSSFANGEELDFVHVSCLARAWAAVDHESRKARPPQLRNSLLEHLERYRTSDGGYNPTLGGNFGTAYGCFLALGAYQDLSAQVPEP